MLSPIRTLVSTLAVLALILLIQSSQASAQLFQWPEQLEPLHLDASGSNNWNATVSSISPAAGVLYPGDNLTLQLTIENKDPAPIAGVPVLEVVRVSANFEGYAPERGDQMISGFKMRTVPLSEPARYNLSLSALTPGKNSVTWSIPNAAKDFTEKGLYVVIIDVPGKGRQGVASFGRILPLRKMAADDKRSGLIYSLYYWWDWGPSQLDAVSRLGYKWTRTDGFPNWNGAVQGNDPLGPFDWTEFDKEMAVYHNDGLYIVSNMYGSPASSVTPDNVKAYNMVHDPKYDSRLAEYVQEAVKRYCGPDGSGPLQIIDYQNEPWEGGGISGWKSDSIRYRDLYKIMYDSAHKGSSHITVGGTSSIMNTSDKFFTQADWQKNYKFDVLTDHYVMPYSCWGPRVAKGLGIFSIETETWLGNSPDMLVAAATHFMGAGQRMVTPNHPSQLMWKNGVVMLRPTALAAATFLHFTNARTFQKIVFQDHLPWVYQWGTGTDSAFVLAGDRSMLNKDAVMMYDQIKADGTISLDNLGGKLHAYDIYGNEYQPTSGKLDLPCSFTSVFIEAPGVDANTVIAAIARARMDAVKPVEIFADDFITPAAQAKTVDFTVHNVLNRPISGTVTVTGDDSIKMETRPLPVTLNGGESRAIYFPVASATSNTVNAYQFTYSFQSPDGNASLTEVVHSNVIARGTPKVDGTLASWSAATPVLVYSAGLKRDMSERAWRPWETETGTPSGIAEVRFMYDTKYFYIAARERNHNWKPKPRLSTRNDDALFGTGDMAHTYIGDIFPSLVGDGNCLQVDLGLGLHEHGLLPATWAPKRMLADDDTDYEYDLWGAPDGSTELFRAMSPRLVLANFLPRCEPAGYDPVPHGASAVVKRDGDDTIYEAAIPLADMPELAPTAGKSIMLAFRLPGTGIQEGDGRSRTRNNNLSGTPTWAGSKPSNEIRWGFGAPSR